MEARRWYGEADAGLKGRAQLATVEVRRPAANATSWGAPVAAFPVLLLAAGRAEVSTTALLKSSGEHTAAISLAARIQLDVAPELNHLVRIASVAVVNGTGAGALLSLLRQGPWRTVWVRSFLLRCTACLDNPPLHHELLSTKRASMQNSPISRDRRTHDLRAAGAEVHQPGAAAFNATTPRVVVPSPHDAPIVPLFATAAWRFSFNDGMRWHACLNATTVSRTAALCQQCVARHASDFPVGRQRHLHASLGAHVIWLRNRASQSAVCIAFT